MSAVFLLVNIKVRKQKTDTTTWADHDSPQHDSIPAVVDRLHCRKP